MKRILTLIITVLFSTIFLYGCSDGITEKEKTKVNIDGQYEIIDIIISRNENLRTKDFTWAPWILDRTNTTLGVSDHRPHPFENEINLECLGNIVYLKRLDKTITLSANNVGTFTTLLLDVPFFYNTKFVDNWRGDYKTSDYYSAEDGLTVYDGLKFFSKRYSMHVEYHRKFWQRLKAPTEIMIIGVIHFPSEKPFSFKVKLSKK